MVENIAAPTAAAGVDPGTTRKDSPERVLGAAKQFEALLLGQLLKAAHEADSSGWLGTGDDQASATAMDMAEEQFAQVLAAGKGIGLASMVVAGLQKSR